MPPRGWSPQTRRPSRAVDIQQSKSSPHTENRVDCPSLGRRGRRYLRVADCCLTLHRLSHLFDFDVCLPAYISANPPLTRNLSSVNMPWTPDSSRPATPTKQRRQFHTLEGQKNEFYFYCAFAPGINVHKAYNGDTGNLDDREELMFKNYGMKVTYIVEVILCTILSHVSDSS